MSISRSIFRWFEAIMDKQVSKIGKNIGAKHRGTLPNVGGGAFGAAWLAQILHERLAPSTGKRPGRPTNDSWTKHPKVPMSAETLASLQELSAMLSSEQRKVSPMQVAAQLLEESVTQFVKARRKRSRGKAT
jgi:hypothetical protein